MSSNDRQIPKEIIERQAQELSDMLTELIEKAKELKRRLSGIRTGIRIPLILDSNSLEDNSNSKSSVRIPSKP